MERVFVDTSAWVAFANKRDPAHRAIREALQPFEGRLVTSNFVFDETATLAQLRLGHSVAVRLGNGLLDPKLVHLVRLTTDDERSAWKLFRARADKTFSFTDCTSFVLMRRLKLTQAITLDDDFRQEGFLVAGASLT